MDSGATCNIIPLHVYKPATGDKKLKSIRPSQTKLRTYGQQRVRVVGRVSLRVQRVDRQQKIECEVVEGENYHSILGRESSEQLGLIALLDNDQLRPPDLSEQIVHAMESEKLTKADLLREYPDVFAADKIGLFKGEYDVKIDPGVKPVQHAPQNVLVALRQKVKEELDSMVAAGVITPVSEPTDWISSMVVVPKKDGRMRVCLDPRDLNRAVLREHYPCPTVEDISTRLHGARVFTVLDMKKGFWHIQLSKESSKLMCFNTPFGRYKYRRMPFGLSAAPEVFQRMNHLLIEGLIGVEVIADDFLVFGSDVREHDQNLRAFLRRCRENNVVLSAAKLVLQKEEVPFVGHLASSEGLQASPEKVRAITKMPEPVDVPGVRRFLGMVQYLAKFLPALSDMTSPLRELTKKNVEFTWQKAQQKAFDEIKNAAANTPNRPRNALMSYTLIAACS